MGKHFDDAPTPLLQVPTTTAQFEAIVAAYVPDGALESEDREADDPSWYSTD
ncbi:hypothetical protein [Lacisediminihabitans sp.]|uniref:hypothetical protein n=1 Tax=Lacisediminihabitans sp. TaxID=2787631 RepID=UPI00374DDF84